MEMLTNDQLITLVNGGTMGPLPKLAEAAQAELLRRLNPGKNQIDSLFDMDAIKKQFDEIYCKIKDLHERIDQVTKKMLGEFGGAAIKAGSAQVFKGPELIKLDSNTIKGAFLAAKPERIWRDKDMIDFAHIAFFKLPQDHASLLDSYDKRIRG
jgi:hypothetical protein